MKKDFKIRIYKEANDDLHEIREYIINKYLDVYVAKLVIDRITNDLYKILPFPNSYPIVKINNNKYNIRKKVSGKYLIIFRYDNSLIDVIGVFHSKRLIKNISKEILERIKNN